MLSITNVRPAETQDEKKRQLLVAGGGGIVIAGLLAYLLWPAGDSGADSGIELAATPPMQSAPPPVAVTPQPSPVAPQPATAASTAGLTLYGVSGASGGAAIIGTADGQQRLVRVGRPVGTGLTLKAVEPTYAVLTGNGTDYRLNLYETGATPQGGNAATPAKPRVRSMEALQRTQEMELRMGLEPRLVMGRKEGYRLKEGSMTSLLQKAGMQPGDILISVNGQPINDDERLLGLPAEINAATAVQITFERNGKTQRVKYK